MRAVFSKTRMNWASVVGVVCIALVLVSGMVQVAHFHANGQVDHDCALCMTAHQIARMAPPIALGFQSSAVALVVVVRSVFRPRRPVFFRLISRPPSSGIVTLA
jgi:hypothetical protein